MLTRTSRPVAVLIVLACSISAALAGDTQQWNQWGGPNRDFKSASKGLAESWPEGGPAKLWGRKLGDGFSAVVFDSGKLYTMSRRGDQEVVVCMNAKDGQNVWEYAYDAPFDKSMDMSFGPGPHSTPLVLGDRVYTASILVVVNCLDKNTGKLIWSRDCGKDFGASNMGRGFGVSPMAYRDTIILPIGGKDGAAVVAFKADTGETAWKAQDFEPAYGSPILIRFGGKDQLVVFMGKELAGLDPTNGKLLWRQPHETQYDANISTPVNCGNNILFCSSAYSGGSQAVELTEKDGQIAPKQLWYTRKMRIHHGDAVSVGNHVYGSSGDFGGNLFVCLDLKTGEPIWRERMPRANCVYADGKLLILDEDGNLMLVRATPEKYDLLAKCELLKKVAWTVPTLVDTTLYVRDRDMLYALDLGKKG